MAEDVDVDTVDGVQTLWVDSGKIDACVEYFRAHAVKYLGINPLRGYALRDVEFLKSHADVTGLIVVFPAALRYDLSPISSLKRLRFLILPPEAEPLPLSQFPRLEEFVGSWDTRLDLAGCKALKRLRLRGYKSKRGDLGDLPSIPSLRELGLVQSPLTSLAGISRFPALQRLGLSHLSKLGSLDGIEKLTRLESLDCESCRKLRGHDAVRRLEQLRSLRYFDCGKISTLAFVRDMRSLRDLNFVKTTVADRDLSPLLRLTDVEFRAGKGYSHTPDELDALLRSRRRGGRST